MGRVQGAERSGVHRTRPLIDWFTDLERGDVRLGVAGKIMDAATARRCLEHGADFVILGRAAILHHDFPLRVQADPAFAAIPLPVTGDHLRAEGLGPAFVEYMKTWKGFVAERGGRGHEAQRRLRIRYPRLLLDRAREAVHVDVARVAQPIEAVQLRHDRLQAAWQLRQRALRQQRRDERRRPSPGP